MKGSDFVFWPMAIVTDFHSKKSYSLNTYEGTFSIDEAKKVINTWKSDDKILVLCAYITDSNINEVIYLENNVDAFGNIRYKNEQSDEISKHM